MNSVTSLFKTTFIHGQTCSAVLQVRTIIWHSIRRFVATVYKFIINSMHFGAYDLRQVKGMVVV